MKAAHSSLVGNGFFPVATIWLTRLGSPPVPPSDNASTAGSTAAMSATATAMGAATAAVSSEPSARRESFSASFSRFSFCEGGEGGRVRGR